MSRKRRHREPTIFVVGSTAHYNDMVRALPGAGSWNILSALEWPDVQPPSGRIDFDDLYSRARAIIDSHGPPDAIVGHLDFPVTSLVSLLNKAYGLPGASPEAVARCEHKYWLRLEQAKVMPDRTPEARPVNPFDPDRARATVPAYPFWLKPVKAHSSTLGFLIENDSDLDRALHRLRQKIHFFGEPFNRFLAHIGDTGELGGVDGNYAVAESIISARHQFTMEGYVHRGQTRIYGVVDSLRTGSHASSLTRYQYPADIPEAVVAQATDITARILTRIGYDNAPFNVEFFWDPDSDALNLLEVNPRISKSHAPLFRMVDGASHHKVAIDLSMGREPDMPKGRGKDRLAAKFMLRSYEADGIVKRVPTPEEIAALARILPDIEAKTLVQKDTRLSDLFYEESYSYELAEVFLGGNTSEMIEDAYLRCLDSLEIHIKPMPEPRDP